MGARWLTTTAGGGWPSKEKNDRTEGLRVAVGGFLRGAPLMPQYLSVLETGAGLGECLR